MSRKFKLIYLIVDPSSGQLSASRLCLLALIFVFLPALGVLDALGRKVGWWGQFALIVSSVCGVYGVSTGLKYFGQGSRQGLLDSSPGMVRPAPPPKRGESQDGI